MIKKKITIIVPCYNEEENLNSFFKKIQNIIEEINLDYNVIFIDDGSSDQTWNIINKFSEKDSNITSLKLSKNFGHQAALKAGFDHAIGDFILSLDADHQDPPELLVKMIEKMTNEKLNIVYAQREVNQEGVFKKFSSYLFYFIFNKICKINILQQVSDFRLVDAKVLVQLKNNNEHDLFYRGFVPWMGFKHGVVKFKRENRKYGKSGWNVMKMIDFALTGIFNFSNLPMRISFIVTILMISLFLGLSLYALISHFNGNTIQGWTSLILVLSFLNIGVFFILGLISEYVGRIYNEIKKRPNYIVSDKKN
jgi:polyisoprenyl-phosphate glycosyltransferase